MSRLLRCLLLSVATALVLMTASALEVSVGNDFADWSLHSGYAPYLPLATVDLESDGADTILHYYNATGSSGSAFKSKSRVAVSAGDILTITFEAKGSGTINTALYCYGTRTDITGNWIGEQASPSVTLTADWTTYTASLTARNLLSGETVIGTTTAAEIVLHILNGTDARVRNLHVTRRIPLNDASPISLDDFESDGSRTGDPTRETRNIADGLLRDTVVGIYSTTSTTGLSMGESASAVLPSDGRHFRQFAVRLYELSGEGAKLVQALSTSIYKDSLTLKRVGSNIECSADDLTLMLPVASLPADLVWSVSADGVWDFSCRSLSDSSEVSLSGTSLTISKHATSSWTRKLSLIAASKSVGARAIIDNLMVTEGVVEHIGAIELPWTASPLKTFDPIGANWPLVFSDEFEGASLNTNKWMYSTTASSNYVSIANGALHIKAELLENNTVSGASVISVPNFTYGYFESRLRFTHEAGWWAAFWLNTPASTLNPFLDGFEIDIFEDYTTRNTDPAAAPTQKIDHNLHVQGTSVLKSWNYNSAFMGAFDTPNDDWHTIAVKWTPFEITYYMDGKAIESTAAVSHSPYSTVTFDAFRHGAGLAPISVYLSGVSMATKSFGVKDPTGFTYPEFFDVDYVRVYGYPGAAEGAAPTISLVEENPAPFLMPVGTELTLRAYATPATENPASIRAIHLFDDGYYLATVSNVTEAVFRVPITQDYLLGTKWMDPGRQGTRPLSMENQFHVFAAYAEDEQGRVWHSDVIRHLTRTSGGESTPYLGTPHAVPGTILLTEFDLGGEGVAYHDTTVGNNHSTSYRADENVDAAPKTIGSIVTGEWLNYTVDIAEDATYLLTITNGTPLMGEKHIYVLCDGQLICDLRPVANIARGYAQVNASSAEVELPAGRHVLRLVMHGSFNISTMTLTKLPNRWWLRERPTSLANTADWAPLTPAVSETGDAIVISRTCQATPKSPEPPNTKTEVEFTVVFKAVTPDLTLVDTAEAQTAVTLSSNGLAFWMADGWQTPVLPGGTPSVGTRYTFRLTLDYTRRPTRATYEMLRGEEWVVVCQGVTARPDSRMNAVEFQGSSRLESLFARFFTRLFKPLAIFFN